MKSNILLLALLAFSLVACDKKYIVKHNKVYLKGWNEGSGNYEWLIDSADARTFKNLDFYCDCNMTIGRDKDYIFIDGKRMNKIDPNTFEFLGNYIFRDKYSAYFFGFGSGNLNESEIEFVNPDSIQMLKYPWAKSENKLIWGKNTLVLEDLNDFRSLDDDWGKTKTKIIYDGEILKNAEIESFKIINNYSGKDKYHKFEFGEIVKE